MNHVVLNGVVVDYRTDVLWHSHFAFPKWNNKDALPVGGENIAISIFVVMEYNGVKIAMCIFYAFRVPLMAKLYDVKRRKF